MRARFDSLGLEPAGDDGSYDQRFDMMWFSLSAPNELEIGGGQTVPHLHLHLLDGKQFTEGSMGG